MEDAALEYNGADQWDYMCGNNDQKIFRARHPMAYLDGQYVGVTCSLALEEGMSALDVVRVLST
ncbi:MAG: hypothetical protein G01um101448_40 [Parcubacteria group bacterium Gr01-1014_48]|nr:MAG: hypothetical protein Greene041614_402 [Parcubacteria group bacterium Greene0416_14]TSC74625.1 MAG: hypothetical protein G01um101448_40 [Parcubacteria group bacterium Gr01-1014_48]TSD01576.1 MAG: hypothetical protein Greene101415_156 [Parcubacteria group bacterium Greene1014_15]